MNPTNIINVGVACKRDANVKCLYLIAIQLQRALHYFVSSLDQGHLGHSNSLHM